MGKWRYSFWKEGRTKKEEMKHASLFSGIGGFDLAAQWMGWENVFQVEIDKFCQKVLTKNFPNVTRYGDIKQFDGAKYRGTIDVLTGGFPCQPFSTAGKREGKDDSRYLWPEMLRVIQSIRPRWVVGENVNGIITMENGQTLKRIFHDLEDSGYSIEIFSIRACSVGLWQNRPRFWLIAHTPQPSSQEVFYKDSVDIESYRTRLDVQGNGFEFNDIHNQDYRTCPMPVLGNGVWAEIPDGERDGAINGIPNRMDRIKGLGNAIAPQVAFEIFKAISKS